MFNGFGRGSFGAPGQRVTIRQGIITEVVIPAMQAALSIGFWLLASFVVQTLLVVPFGNDYLATHPQEYENVLVTQNKIWRWLKFASLSLPLFYAGLSMLANVINPNHPAPLAAQDPATVKWPWPIAVLLGVSTSLPWPFSIILNSLAKKEEKENMNAPTATAQAEMPREFTLEWCENGNKRTKRRATVGLFMDDWRLLGVMAQNAEASFSIRALQAGGFKQPHDREISLMLWGVKLLESRENSTKAIEPFRVWLANSGYDHSPKRGEVIII